ncbi:MAG: hypothetical protein ABSB94_17930 [Syntrophorhabdales bacterium]|jgi:hypothetical protein
MVTIEPKQKPRVGAGPIYVDTEEGFVKQIEINGACNVPGRSSAINKREKIKQFSTKARRRLIKVLCRFPHWWRFRFEFGFADDMMEGKTLEEKARYGYTVLHRTQDLIKAKYPDLQIIYKREWQGRKSGKNKGESCPHYHFMAYGPGWTGERYTQMFTHVALKWVSYSKTKEIGKALAVIMHRKSFGFLRENDRYVTYFAKYVSKKSTIEGEGIGRFWGMVGPVEQAEGEEQKVSDGETIWLKRFLRGYLRSTQKRKKRLKDGSVVMVRPKRRYEKALRNDGFAGFVAIRGETVRRVLDLIQEPR